MPNETMQAIEWALTQEVETNHDIVDKVREYFNASNIIYNTFSYNDLIPYLPAGE